ncbi:AEC family transporter [Klebsiella pneumoniae]
MKKPAPRVKTGGSTAGDSLPVLMWRSVKKPIVWGPLLGVVLSAIGTTNAGPAAGVDQTAGRRWPPPPAALFLTGVILSARKLQLNALIATSTIVKLLVQPFIAWGLVMLLGLHGSIAITAILDDCPGRRLLWRGLRQPLRRPERLDAEAGAAVELGSV